MNTVTWFSDYRLCFDWRFDLLTTLTHASWLHFTVHCYKHTHTHTHTYILLCSHFVTFSTRRFLVTAINNGDSSASALTPLSINHRLTTQYFRIRVRVTLRLAVYRKSVSVRAKPLETHYQYFLFPTEHLHSLLAPIVLIIFRHGPRRHTVSNSSSTVACGSVAMGTCLFAISLLSNGSTLYNIEGFARKREWLKQNPIH
jgi:hypothetical protein